MIFSGSPFSAGKVVAAEEQKLTGHVGDVRSVAWKGELVASGGVDGTARVWRPTDGREMHVLTGHAREVRSVSNPSVMYILTVYSWSDRLQVVDNVLKDHDATDQVLYNRARGLLLLGAIFKSTVPDESDEERRELERYVYPSLFMSAGSVADVRGEW